MFRPSSIPIKALFLIAASVLIFAVAADQFPELLSLTDNTSNDFTIRKEGFTANALRLSVAGHNSIRLNPKGFEDDKWILRPPTFGDAKSSSADFLLLSVLRR